MVDSTEAIAIRGDVLGDKFFSYPDDARTTDGAPLGELWLLIGPLDDEETS
jgi:hypothetical protein